jgi:acyl-CoA thioester hydrolase
VPTETFDLPIAIQPADIDELGHVNNVTYLRWVQDVAIAHWQHAASAEAQAQYNWVVLRHEIDYRKAARPGDSITARTWVGQASRLKFERHTQILRSADGEVLAQARTVWCPVDARTGAPTPVTPEVRVRFSQ